jgi:hypothetical protein
MPRRWNPPSAPCRCRKPRGNTRRRRGRNSSLVPDAVQRRFNGAPQSRDPALGDSGQAIGFVVPVGYLGPASLLHGQLMTGRVAKLIALSSYAPYTAYAFTVCAFKTFSFGEVQRWKSVRYSIPKTKRRSSRSFTWKVQAPRRQFHSIVEILSRNNLSTLNPCVLVIS